MIDWENMEKISKFKSENDIREFESLLEKSIIEKDPLVLQKLIDLFYDDCEFPQIMYSLLHAIESYPNDIYIHSVIKKIPYGLKNYPEWICRIVNRILNNEECRELFYKNMDSLKREELLELADRLEENYDQHYEMFRALKK